MNINDLHELIAELESQLAETLRIKAKIENSLCMVKEYLKTQLEKYYAH